MRLFWTGSLILALRAILENVKSGLQGTFQGFDVKFTIKEILAALGPSTNALEGLFLGVSKVKNSGLEIAIFYNYSIMLSKMTSIFGSK